MSGDRRWWPGSHHPGLAERRTIPARSPSTPVGVLTCREGSTAAGGRSTRSRMGYRLTGAVFPCWHVRALVWTIPAGVPLDERRVNDGTMTRQVCRRIPAGSARHSRFSCAETRGQLTPVFGGAIRLWSSHRASSHTSRSPDLSDDHVRLLQYDRATDKMGVHEIQSSRLDGDRLPPSGHRT